MGTIATVLIAVGAIVMLVGGIMILVAAFKKSVGWGIASLLVPFVALIFAIMNWAECKKAFLIWVAGLIVYIIGAVVGVSAAKGVIDNMEIQPTVGVGPIEAPVEPVPDGPVAPE